MLTLRERARLAAFVNAMIRLIKKSPGTVREMPMRTGFSIKPKKQKSIKIAYTTTHQTRVPKE